MVTGYWPINGMSLAILPREGDAVVIHPSQDERWMANCFVDDRRSFVWGDTRHMDPLQEILPLVAGVARDRNLIGKRIGIEICEQ